MQEQRAATKRCREDRIRADKIARSSDFGGGCGGQLKSGAGTHVIEMGKGKGGKRGIGERVGL